MIVRQCAHMLSDLKQVYPVTQTVFSCVQVVYQVGSFSVFKLIWQHLKTQMESYEAMKSLANSIQMLADQLDRLKEVRISDQLCCTMREFPEIMEEVVNFIWRWLKNWKCTCPRVLIWVNS